VEKSSWSQCPLLDTHFDCGSFYIGGLARDCSHPLWRDLFVATERSQHRVITQLEALADKSKSKLPASDFVDLCRRTVVSENVARRVASLKPAFQDAWLAEVDEGLHDHEVDQLLSACLPEEATAADVEPLLLRYIQSFAVKRTEQQAAVCQLLPSSFQALDEGLANQSREEYVKMLQRDQHLFGAFRTSFETDASAYESKAAAQEHRRMKRGRALVTEHVVAAGKVTSLHQLPLKDSRHCLSLSVRGPGVNQTKGIFFC
jgi:hypothetical protein